MQTEKSISKIKSILDKMELHDAILVWKELGEWLHDKVVEVETKAGELKKQIKN